MSLCWKLYVSVLLNLRKCNLQIKTYNCSPVFIKFSCQKMSSIFSLFRSSHRRYSVRKGVLRNFAKFTGKHLCQSLFFNKVAGLRSAALLKKRLWRLCFPVNFVKFLRTPFLQNTSGRLLLFALTLFILSELYQKVIPTVIGNK